MNRALVTGATGFIGRHAAASLLRRGYEVHAVSSNPPDDARDDGDKREDVRWHRADLLDTGDVSRLMRAVEPTHLLHFAWYAVPGKYWTSLENFRWVRASLDLLQAFEGSGGKRAVFAGTCAEYDWNYELCSEQTTPLAPATLYGTCKHALRLMLDAYGRQTGLSTAWGRIFFLYGTHEHPDRLVASVARALLKGEAALCSHGRQVRDFLYVEDVADAFVALLASEVGGAVNIASGRPVALKTVVEAIARQLEREDLLQLGARPAPANEPPVLTADVARLGGEVGWRPHYSLDAGLEKTIAWWRAQLA